MGQSAQTMARLTWVVFIFVISTFHSSHSNTWTSLLQESSQENRKTDVPEYQGKGWTSLMGDKRKGRLISHVDENGGWTSLLNKYDRLERAPKIISLGDREANEDTIAD